MKRPQAILPPNRVTLRRAYSADGGTTWTFDDFNSPENDGSTNPNQAEFDPMTAFDPVSNALFVGGLRVANGVYVARREEAGLSFTTPVLASFGGSHDKPWMAAGPHPQDPLQTRVYCAAGKLGDNVVDIIWSDDLGVTWSDPFSAFSNDIPLPRVGAQGQVYVAIGFGRSMKLAVSTSVDQDGAPIFTESTIHIVDVDAISAWIASQFRVIRLLAMAVHPTDGKRVYVVYFDKTSDENGNKNMDL